jgi:taurine dioxygenase
MSATVNPLSNTIGAEIQGVDLSGPLPPDDLKAMKQALIDHLILVIRDQKLDPAALLSASRLFGETMEQHLTDRLMEEHPEIAVLDSRKMPPDNEGRVIPFGGRDWHTDHTNHERPPKYTALYAVKLPSEGGDTSFANMQVAYNALGTEEQRELGRLRTANKIEDFGYISAEAREKFGNLPIHPLIRTHPDTGNKAIYVHPGKLERIVGREPRESLEFIKRLLERVITPAITYRHVWRKGDLLLCDNRAVLHLAHRDYDMAEGRVMHRLLLRGERPV